MRILFCRIMNLRYYKGVVPFHDQPDPRYGGLFVKTYGFGNEEFNFTPTYCKDHEVYCFGFADTKMTKNDHSNSLHIERIDAAAKNQKALDDVLVVWCTTISPSHLHVVGWYKHARVNRRYRYLSLTDGDYAPYLAVAKADDCVLMPVETRREEIWRVPTARVDGYGFGQANFWYADQPQAAAFKQRIIQQIMTYTGDNWVTKTYKDIEGQR